MPIYSSVLSSKRAATHTSPVTSRAAGLGAKGSPSRWAVPAQFHRNTAGLDVLLCELFLQKVASLPFYLIRVFSFNFLGVRNFRIWKARAFHKHRCVYDL